MKSAAQFALLIPLAMLLVWPQFSRGSEAWTLEYVVRGGVGGSDRRLELTESGVLSVGNSNAGGSRVTTRGSTELMARIEKFLKTAKAARPASGITIPDALYTLLTLSTANGSRELEIPRDLQALLMDTADTVLKKAFIGAWWQSAWKLCHPVGKLTAAEIDPPIESLVFESDGRFSVTWQGGGARAYTDPSGKVPHVAVSDYVGRYRIEPEYSYIQLSVEGGIREVRDFSGDGHFRLNENTLVLQHLWLGTYRAKHRPDICELTFTRAAGAAQRN